MIQTSTYTFSPKTYFSILIENRLRRYWWLYLAMIAFSLASLSKFGDDTFITAYILACGVYLVGLIIYLILWASSEKNRNPYIPHSLTVDENKITSSSVGDVHNEIPLKFIKKAVERKTYWLLYVAKSHFLYIPKAAFPTSEDGAAFRKLIAGTKNNSSHFPFIP
jgi:hypothetical protein